MVMGTASLLMRTIFCLTQHFADADGAADVPALNSVVAAAAAAADGDYIFYYFPI